MVTYSRNGRFAAGIANRALVELVARAGGRSPGGATWRCAAWLLAKSPDLADFRFGHGHCYYDRPSDLEGCLCWFRCSALDGQVNEEQLIQAAQQGDLDAFNRLVVSYQGLAYNLAFRLLSDPAAAEDATQDAFISAFRNIRSYRGGSFKAWLLRIVTNGSYDELRRQQRKPQAQLEPGEDNGLSPPEPAWLADPGEGPQELAERVELSRAIQHCLSQLEVEFRIAVVLVDVQGMDYAEAARVMKRPLGTIKSRLARARTRLQLCLQGFEELLPERFRLIREGIV